MRSTLYKGAALVIAAAVLAAWAPPAQAQDACGTESYGTTIDWQTDYDRAVKKAGRDGRLLFLMHISGELPDADST